MSTSSFSMNRVVNRRFCRSVTKPQPIISDEDRHGSVSFNRTLEVTKNPLGRGTKPLITTTCTTKPVPHRNATVRMRGGRTQIPPQNPPNLKVPKKQPANARYTECVNNCKNIAVLIAYPCGHPFCAQCCHLDMEKSQYEQDHQNIPGYCTKCMQNFKCFAGIPDLKFFYSMNAPAESEMKVFSKLDEQLQAERQLEEMQRQLEDLRNQWDCQICFDAKCDIAFGCGHRACSVCADKIKRCHYCRELIEQRIKIFR
ncbi:unnamed protein product [Bursaphelenchus okinawaensis]|uniref:RING-type domain-containing protein n=1 Tax=Bursaphelenchus okinawaensis TaxID=465554 RepID=A0A811JQJ2_9BILA|nr:unnamed protein product [Bursaphelenchus okinawaensis]CAG9078585.1 unnamed protein product [Bursaphelenchus okinawaensis]